jgi:hypothetical protein
MCANASGWTLPELIVTGITALAAVAAVVVATRSLATDRWFRNRDSLNALLSRFESEAFYVRMWRVEQSSRPKDSNDPSSLEPFDIDNDPRVHEPVVRQALARDWEHGGATMHDVYFFALRVRAWLAPDGSTKKTNQRTRLLNASFGYSLVGTLLDHRVIACRLRRPDKGADYFPTQYGCLDREYRDLVDRLWNDLKRHPSTPTPIVEALRARYEKTEAYLLDLEA